ncbi:hypothetical protein MKX01_037546 [Papaver californicum]|nr:hypothetical protein MKX01_037546 [Papaver californicum]
MLSNQIQQTIIMDSSNFTHLKPDIEKDKVLGFIPSEISVRQSRAMYNKEMVKQVVSEGFQVNPVITTNDDPSSVLMVELNQKEVSEEPISQLQNRVKKNQECEEPMGKGSIEFYDSFIAEEKKEDQFEISSKDSAKEEMMNSESSSRIEGKQDEVLQVQDVITGDQHVILVVETKSMSPSQNLVERSNWDLYSDKKRTISHEMMIGSDEINWGKWGESSASGNTSSNGMAKIENTHIVNGNGCAREGMLGSIALGKRSSGICSENIRQQVKKGSRRNFTETNLKKDELSMFVEATNVFCQKKSDGSKRSYSREEMEELRG